jgi:hypothetical protein
VTQNIAALTERNIALYKALNDLDDSRECYVRALSSGPHEACTAYGHYDLEEVDDGGRLIERRERGIGKKFIPVSELPATLEPDDDSLETEHVLDMPDTGEKPLTHGPSELQMEDVRYLVSTSRITVIRRRRLTLHAI